MRYLDQARAMLTAAGNTHNLADAYRITFWVYYDQGRLPEVLHAIEEARKHVQLTENVAIQAQISLDFGRFLFSANRDAEAWEYIEISLIKASYIGNWLTVAQALEYMGYGYLRRGDYQNAYSAYEAAAKNYIGTVDANSSVGECKDNMARIKQKQENTETVIGFYRPSVDVNKSLFTPPVQASVADMPISGS